MTEDFSLDGIGKSGVRVPEVYTMQDKGWHVALLLQKEASDKSPKSEKSDVFRLDFEYSTSFQSEFGAETLILLKDI